MPTILAAIFGQCLIFNSLEQSSPFTACRTRDGGLQSWLRFGPEVDMMPTFLYRCPNTGLKVQGWAADDPTRDEPFAPVTCAARSGQSENRESRRRSSATLEGGGDQQ